MKSLELNSITDLKREGKSFYWASFFLPQKLKNNAGTLYSICRFFDDIADKKIPGFGEIFRYISLSTVGTSSIQSRACAALANGKYVFALPGSSGGVTDAWDKILVHQLNIKHKPCNFVELFPRLKEK